MKIANRSPNHKAWAATDVVIIIAAILLPVTVLVLLPFGLLAAFWFWIALAVALIVIWAVVRPEPVEEEAAEPQIRMLFPDEQPEVIRDVMDVKLATEEDGMQVFRGRLRESAASAYDKLKSFFAYGFVPLLQSDDRLGAAVMLVPKPVEQATMERKVRPVVNWLLFIATFLTTTWAGAMYQGFNLLRDPAAFVVGLPYSLGLLAILGIHEMGHYLAARHHGMDVTPPYFIPVPFGLGTFGAFIRMRSPAEKREALFDVAVAGPLAGLVIAIPALLIGLKTSAVVPTVAPFGNTPLSSSFLFTLIAKLSLGDVVQPGYLIRLSPLAFAGWLGLLITALNLLPIGQLDGGHAARAMFGNRLGGIISSVAMWSLILLAVFVWPGLMFWALIVFFLTRNTTPPLNDITPISGSRRWLGFVTFAILALILMPFPHGLWEAAKAHTPYL